MKLIVIDNTTEQVVNQALQKARARMTRPSNAKSKKRRVTRMNGELISSSSNPRRWEH